jgi:AcrR family transcriptional regulator
MQWAIVVVNDRWHYSGMSDSQGKTPKSERTRAAILKAAQELFAARGYERTTVRDIAARASIDAAMVMRYFGSKDELFARAAQFDLRLPTLDEVEPIELGATLVRHAVELWEGDDGRSGLIILLRAAASSDAAAGKVRDVFASQVAPAIARIGGKPDARQRAGLVASQILGLALCRYILKIPPVAEMSGDDIVRLVGPTIQRYAVGELPSVGDVQSREERQ